MVEQIEILTIAKQETIEASGSITSQLVDMKHKEGFASLHLKTSGAGTIQAKYQISNDIENAASGNKSWVDGDTDIVTAHSAGQDVYQMPDEAFFARFLRIILTETGGANSVLADAWLATQ